MPNSVLQIVRGHETIAIVASSQEVTEALQRAQPGRYVVEESSACGELLPSGYSCQRWGVAIRQANGAVMLEPGPAPLGT
jgi:hypothetical protein